MKMTAEILNLFIFQSFIIFTQLYALKMWNLEFQDQLA